jgi:hypothetical protein
MLFFLQSAEFARRECGICLKSKGFPLTKMPLDVIIILYFLIFVLLLGQTASSIAQTGGRQMIRLHQGGVFYENGKISESSSLSAAQARKNTIAY